MSTARWNLKEAGGKHETFPHENGRVAKATATYVYMEVVEEGENESCQLGKVL